MNTMAFTTPAQRITDLESDVYQGTHHIGRLTTDVAALKEQGKLHAELLSEALQDLRDVRIDLAGFKTEVRERFSNVDATLAHQGAQLDALMAHFGVQLPATPAAASN